MSGNTDWLVAAASVRGKAHVDKGIPNQDAFRIKTSDDRKALAVAVCDGAGTAVRAKEGAEHFAEHIASGLIALAQRAKEGKIDPSSASKLNDALAAIVENARNALDPTAHSLRDYHCTLAAMVLSPQLRLIIKIGDSLLMKSQFVKTSSGQVDHFANLFVTQQERSEFANETHFVTQPDWRVHLVCHSLPVRGDESMFALMTDGAGEIAFVGATTGPKKVYRPFFSNVIANVIEADFDARNAVLEQALADPGTFRLTGDDKTIVLILRNDTLQYAGMEPLLNESAPPASAPVPAPVPVPVPTPVPVQAPVNTAATLASSAQPAGLPQVKPSKSGWKLWSGIAAISVFVVGAAGYNGFKYFFGQQGSVKPTDKTSAPAPAKTTEPTKSTTPKVSAPSQSPADPATPTSASTTVTENVSLAPSIVSNPAAVQPSQKQLLSIAVGEKASLTYRYDVKSDQAQKKSFSPDKNVSVDTNCLKSAVASIASAECVFVFKVSANAKPGSRVTINLAEVSPLPNLQDPGRVEINVLKRKTPAAPEPTKKADASSKPEARSGD